MSIMRSACTLCLAFGAVLPALGDTDSVVLAAELEPGQTLSYVYQNTLNQQQFAQDMLVSEHFVDYELEFDMSVVQATDVYIDLEMTFSRISVDSSWGAFDSDTPESEDAMNLTAQAFRPAMSETFSVRLRSNMEVLGVSGPPMDHLAPDVAGLYRRVLDEEYLMESLQPIFRLKSPPEALPTEEWSRMIVRHVAMGQIDIRIDSTLDEVTEDGTARVRMSGEHSMRDMHATPVSPQFKEQRVEGAAAWNTGASLLEEWDLMKDFVMTAGNDQLAFKFNITEREQLSRKAE